MAQVQAVEHVEPSVRVFARWNPATVRAALAEAQQGDFSRAGLLADAVLADDRVQAVIGTRVNGVLSLPLEFDPVDEELQRALDASALLDEDWWRFAPETTLAEWLGYALLVGACAAELVWDVTGERALPVLKVWHPSNLKRDDKGQWMVKQGSGSWLPITPGDGKWALLTPFGSRRPATRSLIRPLSLAYLSKVFAITDWNRYSEVHGTPVRVGTYPAQASAEEKTQFHTDLSELASDATITMPEGWQLALVEAKVGSGEVFQKLIDWADKAVAIAVLGQNLTTDVEGGSFAAAQVHENVRQDLIDGDTETLATTMHDQVVTWWAEFNVGDRGLAPWPDWDSAPPADQVQIATALNGRAEAILKLAQAANMTGLPIDWKAMAETHDLPLLEGVEVTPPPAPGEVQQQFRLASGDDVDAAGDFVAGQLYTDELIDEAKVRGSAAMRPLVTRVLELVDNATSYEELREQLLSEYEHLDVEELRAVTQSTVTLAMLAGRLAVSGGDE